MTDLDDTLLHEAPLPFAFVGTSDHRSYDRYWFEVFSQGMLGLWDPDETLAHYEETAGRLASIAGLAIEEVAADCQMPVARARLDARIWRLLALARRSRP